MTARRTDGQREVMIATKLGMIIRFSEEEVRPMGRGAGGVKGIELDEGDEVIAADVVQEGVSILTVTERGYGKRTKIEDYRLQGRGGSGIINIRVTQKNGPVVGVMEVSPADQIMMVTQQGKIIRMDVDGISVIGRATQGVRLLDVEQGDSVVSVARLPERDEEAEAAKPVAAAPDEDEQPLSPEEEEASDESVGEEDNGNGAMDEGADDEEES